LAKDAALKALDLHWAVSEVGSGRIIMDNPPERSFMPIGGSRDWMDQQIEAMAKRSDPDAQDWYPVSIPQTEGATGVHQTPNWSIRYHDKNGLLQIITPPPDARPGWPFDYQAAYAQAQADFNAVRGSLLTPPPGSVVTPPPGYVFPFMPKPDAGP
jgi:hypothetical protein